MSEIKAESKELTAEQKLADAAAKEVEATLAKLPSIETLQKEIDTIEARKAELAKLQDAKINFGPGKPGKKKFNLPVMPLSLGRVVINGKVLEGIRELTCDEYHNYLAIREERVYQERRMRYGESLAEQELSAFTRQGSGVSVQRTGETAKF